MSNLQEPQPKPRAVKPQGIAVGIAWYGWRPRRPFRREVAR